MSPVAINAAANAASKTSQPSRAMRGCVINSVRGKEKGVARRAATLTPHPLPLTH
jgi:hypothetical protein